ncbi:MAG: ABC transporter ATP-binding protein [Acidobacteriota bacterium]
MTEDNLVLKAEKISKTFINPAGASLSILEEVSLDVRKGELATILGSSSTGKSTLLRILAGVESPDAGTVRFVQQADSGANLALIPTEASSLPWLSVRDNVRLGITESIAEEEAISKINRAINIVGLDGYESHFPANKSVGFRFRISIARALVMDPKVILIDDALRDLRAGRKITYYGLLREILSREGISILYVTNDITEAMLLSDRIFLLGSKPGRIVKEFNIEKTGLPAAADLRKEDNNRIRQEIESIFYAERR